LQEALAKSLETRFSSSSREVGDNWLAWTEQLVTFLDGIVYDTPSIYSTVVKRIKRGDELRSKAMHAQQRLASPPVPLEAPKNATVAWKDLADLPADDFISCVYEQVLGRPADDVGKIHHLKLLDEGRSRAELIIALLASQEYRDNGRNVRIEGLPTAKGTVKSARSLSAIWSWFRI